MNAIATSSKLVGTGLLMLGLVFAGNATAAPTYCSDADPGDHPDGLTINDVTFELATPTSASDCFGVSSGNPPGSGTLPFEKWGDFGFLVKFDDDGMENAPLFDDVSFELENVSLDAISGSWGLKWSGTGLPITLDFIVNLKGSDRYASYLFEGVTFDIDPDSASGTFEMTFAGPGGPIPDLSNLSIFARLGDTPTVVPAPGTLGILGLGLLGMGLITRRRNKS